LLLWLHQSNTSVTDGEAEECVDPGENGAILNVGKVGDPARQGGRETDNSWHQTVEEVRHSQDAGRLEEWARHNIKPALCTEYVSYV
jgi:hypothetical protein